MKPRKKLIEVALPLEAINNASAQEKAVPRRGHPATFHLWWARRPLAAARAVIFSQMVDDPSEYVDVLLGDTKLRRKAESVLKARLKIWEEATATAKKAKAAEIEAPTPGPKPKLEEVAAEIERERLFEIIRELVLWENTTNETVLQAAREEIWASWRRTCAGNADHPRAKELFDRNRLPAFHDPFAGGGALPLEAQRLGLRAYASDLNPVAVLINKATIEIPPRFAGQPPVNSEARHDQNMFAREWRGAQGLAEDVRYYGKWLRDEAQKQIGHLYPPIEVTAEMAKGRTDLQSCVGQKLTVIAWIWARTVKSANPAFSKFDIPLASTFLLSTKKGKEAHVVPVIDRSNARGYYFAVKAGKPADLLATKAGTKLSRGANFRCLLSDSPISASYISGEAIAGRMGARLMAVVADGPRGRVYLPPTPEHEEAAARAVPTWQPDLPMPANPRWFSPPLYGLKTFGDLFSRRQLVALTRFSDLVHEAHKKVERDAIESAAQPRPDDKVTSVDAARAYADAVSLYLAFALSKQADWSNTISSYIPAIEGLGHLFSRQAIPMVWDFIETNVFSESAGNLLNHVDWVAHFVAAVPATLPSVALHADAATQDVSTAKVISTDPPYYDNIGYADLSDFFYVWLRRSLRTVFAELLATVAVPKADELVATPYRHGSREKAEVFFLEGMTRAMQQLARSAHPAFPVTIYYAFKQSESENAEGTASTGWEVFLDAVIRAGFALSGTWPMRTEREARSVGQGTNALASSIVLVCRTRPADAPSTTRRAFVQELRAELPRALAYLQRGNIAPVDLAQAAIGPGMAVFTRYATVLDAEGKPLTVREALALINERLDEALADQEGDFDADSRWALTWFEQMGFATGDYGIAEQLSKSKNTSVAGMVDAGIVESKRGRVRLLRPDELPPDWDPTTDMRLTAWEVVHQLIRALDAGGEPAAATLVAKLGAKSEVARELAYRLYTLCERKKRAAEALTYNGLVQSWPELLRIAREGAPSISEQVELL
jgi:putative DNA methylase